ncbi:MAG: sortase [Actinomycetota bacterium]
MSSVADPELDLLEIEDGTVAPPNVRLDQEQQWDEEEAMGRSQPTLRRLVVSSVALLVLLFLLYEFLGSNLIYARSQRMLLEEFKVSLDAESVPPVAKGDPVGVLSIPAINLEIAIVEGTTPADLEQGIGHFRGTPFPGNVGNSVMAGRRTTFGAPLRAIDEIDPGDVITVSTRQGIFEYSVTDNRVVKAGDDDVLGTTADDRLTLVTSHPAYLAQHRRAVIARLEGAAIPAPALAGPIVVERNEQGLSGDSSAVGELIVFLEVLALLVAAGIVAYRRRSSTVVYLLGGPLVILVLFLVFDQLNRLLPATL